MIIWIHVLSCQLFSRQSVTPKRSLFKIHQLLFRVTGWREMGWYDNRWIQIIIFTSNKSRQVNGWCQNHVNAKIKADESNLNVTFWGIFLHCDDLGETVSGWYSLQNICQKGTPLTSFIELSYKKSRVWIPNCRNTFSTSIPKKSPLFYAIYCMDYLKCHQKCQRISKLPVLSEIWKSFLRMKVYFWSCRPVTILILTWCIKIGDELWVA